jgi:hypothetical protein
MVAMEGLALIQTHCSQGRADGAFSRSEDRSRHKHLDMLEDALGEKWRKGVKTRIIMVGRARIIVHLFRRMGDERTLHFLSENG